MAEVTPGAVKSLREKTGAGMMECKRALQEANGNEEQAIEILRKRGMASASKRAGRVAAEGVVGSYIHMGGKVGVLVEINCETDFVARTPEFKEFAQEVAQHIAALGPEWVGEEHVPAEFIEAEKRVFEQEAADKPEQARPKIVEGKLRKRLEETVLLHQEHVNPKHEGKTIEQLRADVSAKTGENVVVRRFARFQVGAE